MRRIIWLCGRSTSKGVTFCVKLFLSCFYGKLFYVVTKKKWSQHKIPEETDGSEMWG